MGYSYNFENDVLYGVDDVNNIVANFTSAGVSTYSDLNGIAGALTSAGVTDKKTSCMVTLTSSENLKILPGVAFFGDGSTVTIDSEGVELEAHKYVYFKKDSITGKGYPFSSDNAPGINDIPLAEYQDGVLTDKRSRAVSKIEGFGTNVSETITYNLTNVAVQTPSGADTVTYKVGSIVVKNPGKYKRVIVSEPYGTFIAAGKIATTSEAQDADYSYAYHTGEDGFTHFESGGQQSFMIYGRSTKGKIYASFLPSAVGFDLYLTVEKYTGVNLFDIDGWIITFC